MPVAAPKADTKKVDQVIEILKSLGECPDNEVPQYVERAVARLEAIEKAVAQG